MSGRSRISRSPTSPLTALDVRFTATASAYYSGQSGRPYSLSYNLDYNGDLRGFNDLVYIPANASEVQFTNGSFTDFQQFIQSDKCLSDYIGQIHERNACRSPWMNTMDFRVNVGLPFRRVRAEVTWDLLNLFNVFGNESGLVEFASFNQLTVIRPTFAANGQPIYNISGLFANGQLQTPEQLMIRDDLRSRWQMQLGARIRF